MAPAVVLEITGLAVGGDGIGRGADGRVVFVPGALPGERVRAELTEIRRDFARAGLIEVVSPSADRVSPPCPYVAAGCGGCGWQHVALPAQTRLKVDLVAATLRRQGGLVDPSVAAGPGLPGERARTTLRVAVAPDGTVGFRARRSTDVVPVTSCLVAHPALDELLPVVRCGPGVAEVLLRCGVATGERAALARPGGELHGLPPDVAVGERAVVHEDILGHRFRISMPSFFQARPDGAAVLVEAVRDAVAGAPDGPLLDAYGGVGLFAALVDPRRPVVLVEQSRTAVADARSNLAGRPATVIRSELARWRPAPMAVVVADPARTGLGPTVAERLAATGASRLVLVSCDAASLARDAKLLAMHGYRHIGSTVVDLFPHTPHVEVVTRFDHG